MSSNYNRIPNSWNQEEDFRCSSNLCQQDEAERNGPVSSSIFFRPETGNAPKIFTESQANGPVPRNSTTECSELLGPSVPEDASNLFQQFSITENPVLNVYVDNSLPNQHRPLSNHIEEKRPLHLIEKNPPNRKQVSCPAFSSASKKELSNLMHRNTASSFINCHEDKTDHVLRSKSMPDGAHYLSSNCNDSYAKFLSNVSYSKEDAGQTCPNAQSPDNIKPFSENSKLISQNQPILPEAKQQENCSQQIIDNAPSAPLIVNEEPNIHSNLLANIELTENFLINATGMSDMSSSGKSSEGSSSKQQGWRNISDLHAKTSKNSAVTPCIADVNGQTSFKVSSTNGTGEKFVRSNSSRTFSFNSLKQSNASTSSSKISCEKKSSKKSYSSKVSKDASQSTTSKSSLMRSKSLSSPSDAKNSNNSRRKASESSVCLGSVIRNNSSPDISVPKPEESLIGSFFSR